MRKSIFIILFASLLFKVALYSQAQHYIVKIAPFSTRTNNEFSPVYYKGGIVFCSDQRDNSPVSFTNGQTGLFKIFYVEKKDSTTWKSAGLLAKEITSAFNDGPSTFTKNGDTIYFSRNNSIQGFMRNISDTSNKLGIYSAELKNGIWTDIRAFPYNDPAYSLCTPALTPDGKRIYFASDMPGGIGGMDLYYCNRRENHWDKPVNLGPAVNTPKNESFPFADGYGKLYFASDGHPGFGGKDLYFTREINGKWITPVHLDSMINSPADDFGLVTDSTFEHGYFSSNRRKTDDIYSFSVSPIEFSNCDTLKENNYCFTFYDEQHRQIDTIQALYRWDFGDGLKYEGTEVEYCFPGPGKYTVKLTITDEFTGDTIAQNVEYPVDIKDFEQPYFNSSNVGIADRPVAFDALKTNLSGFKITDYFWDFGDGFKPGGPAMSHSFKKKNEYTVRLGLLGKNDSLGTLSQTCVLKKIRIFNSYQELKLKEPGKTDTVEEQNKTLQSAILLMDDLSEKQKDKIRDALMEFGKFEIGFDPYGIEVNSFPFLDKILAILKENSDIRLEIVIHATEDIRQNTAKDIAEKWAGEIALYFKNNGIALNALNCKGFDISDPSFKPFLPYRNNMGGEIELLFMKNQ